MQQKGIFTTFAKSISVKNRILKIKSRKKHKLLSKKSADNAIYLNEQNSYN